MSTLSTTVQVRLPRIESFETWPSANSIRVAQPVYRGTCPSSFPVGVPGSVVERTATYLAPSVYANSAFRAT